MPEQQSLQFGSFVRHLRAQIVLFADLLRHVREQATLRGIPARKLEEQFVVTNTDRGGRAVPLPRRL